MTDPDTVYLAIGTGVDRDKYHTDPECYALNRAQDRRTVSLDALPHRRECKVCAGERAATVDRAESRSCRQCGAEKDVDGTCPFCDACDDIGVTNGRTKAHRRARREALDD